MNRPDIPGLVLLNSPTVGSCGEIRCQFCGSPKFVEDSCDLVCLDCATVIIGNNNLVPDYDYSTHSTVRSVKRSDSRDDEQHCDGGMTKRQRLLVAMSESSRIQNRRASVNHRDAFEDVRRKLVVTEHVLTLAKEMMDGFCEREVDVSFRGTKRRMLASACVMFSMRDLNHGAMRKDEIADKMEFLVDRAMFGEICDKVQQVLLVEPCNEVFKRCLTRELTIDDMLNRILDNLCPTRLSDDQKKVLRSTTIKVHDRLKATSSTEFKNFQRNKQIGGIVWMACLLQCFDETVSARDVAVVCSVCEASVKTAQDVVRGILVANCKKGKKE